MLEEPPRRRNPADPVWAKSVFGDRARAPLHFWRPKSMGDLFMVLHQYDLDKPHGLIGYAVAVIRCKHCPATYEFSGYKSRAESFKFGAFQRHLYAKHRDACTDVVEVMRARGGARLAVKESIEPLQAQCTRERKLILLANIQRDAVAWVDGKVTTQHLASLFMGLDDWLTVGKLNRGEATIKDLDRAIQTARTNLGGN